MRSQNCTFLLNIHAPKRIEYLIPNPHSFIHSFSSSLSHLSNGTVEEHTENWLATRYCFYTLYGANQFTRTELLSPSFTHSSFAHLTHFSQLVLAVKLGNLHLCHRRQIEARRVSSSCHGKGTNPWLGIRQVAWKCILVNIACAQLSIIRRWWGWESEIGRWGLNLIKCSIKCVSHSTIPLGDPQRK